MAGSGYVLDHAHGTVSLPHTHTACGAALCCAAGGPRRGGNGGPGGSILDKAAAEDKAILQMGGFKLHSEGVRGEPLEED